MRRIGDHHEISGIHSLGHPPRSAQEVGVLLSHHYPSGHREGGQLGQAVGTVQQLPGHGCIHGRGAGPNLSVTPLDVAGARGPHPFVRRRPRLELEFLDQIQQGWQALGSQHLYTHVHDRWIHPLGRAMVGVHEHQTLDAGWVIQYQLLRNHSAHRMAEQGEALPAEMADQCHQVCGEHGQRIARLVLRHGAPAMTSQVWGHHPPAVGRQRIHPVEEIFLGAGEPVDQKQRPSPAARLGDREIERAERHHRYRQGL